jgi:hypothetical protein
VQIPATELEQVSESFVHPLVPGAAPVQAVLGAPVQVYALAVCTQTPSTVFAQVVFVSVQFPLGAAGVQAVVAQSGQIQV